ncbi:MAG: LamG-like jellyroll fold domain-containing protein [Victivallaceae bacterium]
MFKSLLCKGIVGAIVCCGVAGFSADQILNLESKDGKFQDTSDNKLDVKNTAGVTSVNLKNITVMQIPLKGSLYINQAPSLKYLAMGKDNMTLSAMVKLTGSKGQAYVMCNGAGNFLSPGYRLGAVIDNGKINFYLLLVGKPFEKNKSNKIQIDTDVNKRPDTGSWLYVTAVINRESDATLYVNGEVVGKSEITKLAAEELSNNYFCSSVTTSTGETPCEMMIANIAVTRGLVSSVTIEQNTDKWQDAVQ